MHNKLQPPPTIAPQPEVQNREQDNSATYTEMELDELFSLVDM